MYLYNLRSHKPTIPVSITLDDSKRILVISGPNAGGKTVTLKTVGLLQMMVQSGLLVPVHELSEFGIYEQIFADIGDQQSLDDDLSTYSSRLQNARVFMAKANPRTLARRTVEYDDRSRRQHLQVNLADEPFMLWLA